MKLDTKRTFLVGFAFLSITAFWQMYNSIIPLILTQTFRLSEDWAGSIMAADNVLALFLLPIFGSFSDKHKGKLGRRKPFIICGTLVSVALMMCLPFLDNSYFTAPNTLTFAVFVGVLGLLLISMATYRSPAVALMPDVTPKPLRSKGNAVINLMGAVGGIIYLILASLLYSSARVADQTHVSYVLIFSIIAGLMLLAAFVVFFAVDEPKLAAEVALYESMHPEENLMQTDESTGKETMPADVKRSLLFILFSISLWFIGYNAVETWFSVYATTIWGMELGDATLCLTIASVGAIVSYIPVGAIASRIGRKKTIKAGVVLLALCFMTAAVYTQISSSFHVALYALFVLIGVAWASINVNSLPMVVEMCKGDEIGKFTGYYYTFSMSAQTITPIVAGWILKNISYEALFPYAAIFVAFSFITMSFVQHGDNKLAKKSALEAYDTID